MKRYVHRRLQGSSFKVLLCMTLATLLSCDPDDDAPSPIIVIGEQTEPLRLSANAIVDVEGNLSFADSLSPAIILTGDVTFRMDSNAEFFWPLEWEAPEGARIRIQAKSNVEFWNRVHIPSQCSVQIENLEINQARIGVFAESVVFLGLDNVTIDNCQQYGVYISQSDSFSLLETHISHCTDFCISTRSSRGSILGSSFQSAERGLDNIGSQIVIRDSKFSDNTVAGIYVQGAGAEVDIEYCEFSENHNALYNNERTSVRFVRNNVLHQKDYALYIRRPIPTMLFAQNNISPGGSDNNRFLRVQPNIYIPEFYMVAGNNWWGTTDTTLIRAGLIDGYWHAHTDTIRIFPVLPAIVSDAGPR